MTKMHEHDRLGRARRSVGLDRLRYIYHLTALRIHSEIRNYSLGFLWWFLDPLINTAILYVVTAVILQMRNEDTALNILIGLLVFRFLQSAITKGAGSLRPAFKLSERLYVPKYVFVISDVLAEAFKFVIGTTFVIALLWLLGRGDVSAPQVLIVTAVAFLFSLACASLVSVAAGLVRDVQVAIQYAFRLLFFVSGTFFSLEQVPTEWQTTFLLNPFALLIQEYRVALMLPEQLNYAFLGLLMAVSLILLAFGQWILIRYDRVLPKYVI